MMHRFKGIFLVMALILVACDSKTNDSEANQPINSDVDPKELAELERVALSFHKWYMAALDKIPNSTYSYNIVADKNGKCRVDFYDYFDALRKLGTISEKFLESEKKRVKSCSDYLKTTDYKEFASADAYVYDEYCPDLYYMYWIRSQEPYTGIELKKLIQKGNTWEAHLVFYDGFGQDKVVRPENNPKVTIEKEGEHWKITAIDWED
jgi:hypothetical protein